MQDLNYGFIIRIGIFPDLRKLPVGICGCRLVSHGAFGAGQPQQRFSPVWGAFQGGFKSMARFRSLFLFEKKLTEKLIRRFFGAGRAKRVGQFRASRHRLLHGGDGLICLAFGGENRRLQLDLLNLGDVTLRVAGRKSGTIEDGGELRKQLVELGERLPRGGQVPAFAPQQNRWRMRR